VGLGEAARIICGEVEERARLRGLAETFWGELKKICPATKLNGPENAEKRVPGVVHVTLPGLTGEMLVQGLDTKGFAVSSGPACAAGAAPPSHVLLAMGRNEKDAKQGLRISFGRSNTLEEAKKLAEALAATAKNLQEIPSF
jgi:cysteine desulfurase